MTAQRLKELFHYDADTGQFTRFRAKGRWPDRVGAIRFGYLIIKIDYKLYRAHRLAWLYVHGEWPSDQIDHINGDRADNRISNLRAATNSQNKQNARKARSDSRSGLIGAMWESQKNKWRAVILVDGKKKHLGYFDQAEQAHAVYIEAKRTLHPFCTI
jgi:hypothetical protein